MNVRKEIKEGKGLHWGDLEYGKKAENSDKMVGMRGTGHFGTGFYVVSQDKYGDMHYDYNPKRPIYEIDLDAYKLFKPKNVEDAYNLHSGLKMVNYQGKNIDNYDRDCEYPSSDMFDKRGELDDFYYEYLDRPEINERIDDLDDLLGSEEYDSKLDELYNELEKESIIEYAKENGYYDKLLKKCNNDEEKLKNLDRRNLRYYIEDSMRDSLFDARREYEICDRAVKSLDDLSRILNVNREKLKELILQADNKSQSSGNSISTELMKRLGYEGIDVTHLKNENGTMTPDDFTYGSVVYDLKPGTYKKIMDARKNESLEEDKNQKQTIVAYHGTWYPDGKFDSFKNYGINWFTQDLELAKSYGNNIFKCEISFNYPFYVGECNYYLSEMDEDEEYYDEPTNTLVPDYLCDIADRLGVEVSQLLGIYSGTTSINNNDEYGDVNILNGQLYDITSEPEFGELCLSDEYDCIIQEENGIITYGILNPDNIKILGTSFEEGLGTEMSNEYESSINESLKLNEVKRSQLINKTKNSDDYKDTSKGKNRYERRTKSRIATSVAQYNKVDMDALFKRDILTLGVDVHGETDDYVVTVRFVGLLREVQNEVKANKGKLEYKVIARAMSRVFNSGDVSLHCTCPDFKYRQSYNASKQNYGTQYEPRPSNITNPNDTKGGGCKHCMLVLSNLDWMMKVSSVINNYIKYCQNNLEYNYATYIFPKVYGVPYKQAVQQSLFDNGGYLASDQKTVGDVAKRNLGDKDKKGKFIVGNKYRFNKKQNGELEDDDNQLRFNFDSNEKELVPEEENQSVNGQNINKPNNQ